MTIVMRLGNRQAISLVQTEDSNGVPARTRVPIEGDQVTTIRIPDEWSYAEMIHTITHGDGIWKSHSDADSPDWIECSDDMLGSVLSVVLGCPQRPYVYEVSDDES